MRDNRSEFIALRERYPRFSYDFSQVSITSEGVILSFQFTLSDDYVFRPVTVFPWNTLYFSRERLLTEESRRIMDELAFHIGMVELVSYWKAACPPTVVIPPGKLSIQGIEFWKKLYFNGLGEFFYTNSISVGPDEFMKFDAEFREPYEAMGLTLQERPLIPVGGGKDSAVTAGLAEEWKIPWIPFAINPSKATQDVILAAGKSDAEAVTALRGIDPLLLRLNSEGFLNGHTPFSAAVAFYGLFAAFLCGSGDIILSNESSANEATVPGTHVNHQYSKTFAFEMDFRQYTRDFISPDFNYFSLLRPLTELQIARLFCHHPEFFDVFRSCNAGSKSGEWCGKCPKCLFTWIILSPFIRQEALRRIFGRDLLTDPSLRPILEELCGAAPVKPFECVGTTDEVNLAMSWLLRRIPPGERPDLLKHYADLTPETAFSEAEFQQALRTFSAGHALPQRYLDLLTATYHA